MPLIKANPPREYLAKKDEDGKAIQRIPRFVKCSQKLFKHDHVATVAVQIATDPRAGALLTTSGLPLKQVLGQPAIELLVTAGILKFWSVVSDCTYDGGDDWFWPRKTLSHVDSETGIPGLGKALESVGWAEETPDGLRLPNYARFNYLSTQPAAERKRKQREREAEKLAQPTPEKQCDMSRENAGHVTGHVTPFAVTCHDKIDTDITGTDLICEKEKKLKEKETTTAVKADQASQTAAPVVVEAESQGKPEQPNSLADHKGFAKLSAHEPKKGALRLVSPPVPRTPRSVDELSDQERRDFGLFLDLHRQLVVANKPGATRLFPDNPKSLQTFLSLVKHFTSHYIDEQRNYFAQPLAEGQTESALAAHIRSLVGDIVAFSAAIADDTPVREYLLKLFAVLAKELAKPARPDDFFQRTPFEAICRSADTVSICLLRTDVEPVVIEHQALPQTN